MRGVVGGNSQDTSRVEGLRVRFGSLGPAGWKLGPGPRWRWGPRGWSRAPCSTSYNIHYESSIFNTICGIVNKNIFDSYLVRYSTTAVK